MHLLSLATKQLATISSSFTLAIGFNYIQMPPIRPESDAPIPEVCPEDVWDVSEECRRNVSADIAPLPRKPQGLAGNLSAEPHRVRSFGLVIAPHSSLVDTPRTTRQIEIHETNGSVIRLEDVIPEPIRSVGRYTFRERGARVKRKRNDSGDGRDWGGARTGQGIWLFKVSAVVAVAIIFPMALMLVFNADDASKNSPVKGMSPVVPQEAEKIAAMEDLHQILIKRNEAILIYQAYAQAKHSDDIIPLLRHGASIKETLRSAWQPLNIPKGWMPDSHSNWVVLDEFGNSCAMLEGYLPDQSKYAAYFTNEDNELLLDWKATEAYGTASFKELKMNSGNPHEIRGQLSIVEFYTAAWPEADYQSYRFVSPNREDSIWCYARRSEVSGTSLDEHIPNGEIIQSSQKKLKITLQLARGTADSLPNQWLIKEVLHFGWLAPKASPTSQHRKKDKND